MKDLYDIGAKVEIEYHKAFADDTIVYPSKVLETISSKKLKLMSPIMDFTIAIIPKDSTVTLYIYPRDIGAAIIKSKATVIGREKGPIPSIIVELFGEMVKIQRRQFFRLPLRREIKVQLIRESETIEYSKHLASKAVTRDLGGGGISFITNLLLRDKDAVFLEIPLEEGSVIARALVIRSTPLEDSIYAREVSVKFDFILDGDRERLIKFIFDEQRKLRQKGVL